MSEERVDSKRYFNKKRIIAVIVAFLLVAVVTICNPAVLNYFFGPDNIKISFQSGTKYNAVTYNRGIILLGGDSIRMIDNRGRKAGALCHPSIPRWWLQKINI